MLVTGHTGFKGAWLSLWLNRLGAQVFGVALPATDPQGAHGGLQPEFVGVATCDIRDHGRLTEQVAAWHPDVVFHLAAQALVPQGFRDPIGTYTSNVVGTVNVLDAAVRAGTKVIVSVTSDKVYANDGRGQSFNEDDPLGGHDPYSASKASADLASQSWRSLPQSAGTAIGVARSGNVIGGGDHAPDRLLPDAFRAVTSGAPLRLRNPDAVRPWQHVLEPIRGYLLMAERLLEGSGDAALTLNFGPLASASRPVHEVIELAYSGMGAGTWVADTSALPSEAPLLRIDATRAARVLGWGPRLSLEQAIDWTVEWWRAEVAHANLRELGLSQLARYEGLPAD